MEQMQESVSRHRTVVVDLPSELHDELVLQAAREGLTFDFLCQRELSSYLAEHGYRSDPKVIPHDGVS
jgi:hypothetical protein